MGYTSQGVGEAQLAGTQPSKWLLLPPMKGTIWTLPPPKFAGTALWRSRSQSAAPGRYTAGHLAAIIDGSILSDVCYPVGRSEKWLFELPSMVSVASVG